MPVTHGLPIRHPAVLLGIANLLIGYLGLGYELRQIMSAGNDGEDWFFLLIGAVGLPVITRLFLQLVARPQDFVQPARTVVAIQESERKLRLIRLMGYAILGLWLGIYLYIGIGYLFDPAS